MSEQIQRKTAELATCQDEEGKRKLGEELAGYTTKKADLLEGQMNLKKQIRQQEENPAEAGRAAPDQQLASAKVPQHPGQPNAAQAA